MSSAGKPSPDSPQAAARALGLKAPGGMLTWLSLVDLAVEAYWQRRIVCGPLCGSRRGHQAHVKRGERPCQRCRQAVAMVKAVQRKRTRAAGGGAGAGKPGPLPVEGAA